MKKLASLTVCFTLATAALIAPALTTAASAEDTTTVTTTETTTEPVAETWQQKAERLIAESDGPADLKAKALTLIQALPADSPARIAGLNAKLGLDDSAWSEIANSVINPDDYVCDDTPLRAWVESTKYDWDIVAWIVFNFTPVSILPMYDAIVKEGPSKADTYGTNGEYTSQLIAQKKDLTSFWNIEKGEIQLRPMHGTDVFSDVARVQRALALIFGDAFAAEYAPLLMDFMAIAPALRGGDHPLFTFNAFALDPAGEPELEALGITSRMIVMGDGVMEGLAGIGLDPKVGPRAILAHEYGHQVQYAKHLFDSPLTGPEATRRTELMADAFATYFMVHSRGEALNAARTLDDQKSFFNVGDCQFDNASHHGTPNQRFNAAGWAADVVKQAANQGITAQLGASAFAAKFDAKLPELVAPDAN